ncbi:MAG: histidine kinase [Cyclobacteriaceae bacterium]
MPTAEKRNWKNEIRDVIILIAIGLGMTVIFGYTNSGRQIGIVGSFTVLMWISLWKGNEGIGTYISTKVSWVKTPVKSLVLHSIATILYTPVTVLILMKLYELLFKVDFGDSYDMIYSAMVITIIISLFMHGRGFLKSWKEAELEAERAKRESIKANYESLKNQVNPHFLFNSLNALTNLVYQDQDKAAKFIKQLSEVYRYVLDTRDREVVSLREELNFLESYLFLQQIRFGNNLNIQMLVENTEGNIPPLAIQMLLENAIKHNVISTDQPLTITIKRDKDKLIVENSLQKKRLHPHDVSGVGLENIKRRYEFLSSHEVSVAEDTQIFKVTLPILTAVS